MTGRIAEIFRDQRVEMCRNGLRCRHPHLCRQIEARRSQALAFRAPPVRHVQCLLRIDGQRIEALTLTAHGAMAMRRHSGGRLESGGGGGGWRFCSLGCSIQYQGLGPIQ